MRRIDKEITDSQELNDILAAGRVMHIAMADGDEPYVVPVNYGVCDDAIYIHCAKDGRKIDIIRKNPKVCFNVAVDAELVVGKTSCSWTYHFRSVTGRGRASVLTEKSEKVAALDIIMKHYGKNDNSYGDGAVEKIAIIKIKIEELTGKRSPAVKKD